MKKLFLTLLLSLAAATVFAQTDWYNKGVVVTGGTGVTIYLPGDYIDESPGAYEDDLNFRSLGTFYITGDINNIGTTAIFDYDTAILLTFTGTADQLITGTTSTVLGEVALNKTAGSVRMTRNTELNKSLTLTDGIFNVDASILQFNGLYTGSDTLDIKLLFSESNANYITGTTGHLLYTTAGIQEDFTFTNFGNFGFGFSNGPGLSQFTIKRYFDTDYQVGNLHNTDRSFITRRGSPDSFSNFRFYYLDHELDGMAETALAIYYSLDAGATWIKLASTVDATNNIITSSESVAIAQDQDAIFTLAEADCTVKPGISFASVAGNNVVNDTINICQYDNLLITEPTVAGFRFYEWTSASMAGPVYSNVLSIDSIDFADEGWYVLYERNAPGCESFDSVYVNVRDLPSPSFGTSPNTLATNVCFGESIDFVNASTVTEGTVTTWNWDIADAGTTSSLENPSHTYSASGAYYPLLSVVSSYGCASPDTATLLVEIQALPSVSFIMRDWEGNTISESCERDDVFFINGSSYTDIYGDGDANNSSVWYFPDGTGSTADNPVYDFPNATTGDVKLVYTNNTTGCVDSTTLNLTIHEKPDGLFHTEVKAVDSTEVCQGTIMSFVNETTIGDGTGISYFWDFGDGATSTEVSPEHVYSVAGDYTVYLYSTSDEHPSCIDTVSQDITVNPTPIADFSIADADICIDETAGFTNLSTISGGSFTSVWNFGNGVDSTVAATLVDYDYALPKRSYSVRLDITSDKGCPASRTRTININPLPVANFFALSQCAGDSLIVINGSVGLFDESLSYLWDFDTFGPATVTDTAFANPDFGFYTFNLEVTTQYGCVADSTKTIEVKRNPSVNLGGTQISCTGSYTIDPTAGGSVYLPAGSTYEWYNFAGILQATTETFTVTQTGLYRVRVTTPEGCNFESAVTVNIFDPVELGSDLVSCEPIAVTAETNNTRLNAADATSFAWTKDGLAFATTNTITVTESGTYEVTITRTKDGKTCSDTDALYVTIQTDPNLDLGPDQSACIGESFTFASNLSASSYTWYNLATGAVIGTDSAVTVTGEGSYRLDATIGLCEVSDTVSSSYEPLPTVSFGSSAPSVCLGDSLTFSSYSYVISGSLAADPYRWDFGDGSTGTGQETGHVYAAAGTYTVTLTVETAAGCTDSYSADVEVKGPPSLDFTIVGACAGSPVSITNLTPTDATTTFRWSFGDGTSSTEETPTKTYSFYGTYDVTLWVKKDGCTNSVTKQVEIYQAPPIDLGIDISTCGTQYEIDPGSIGTTYTWSDPATGTVLSNDQAYLVTADMDVALEITNANGCVASDTVTVTLNTAAEVNLGADTVGCESYTLDAGFNSSGIYAWSTGETTREITVTASGTYEVTFTDQNGCVASDQIYVDILSLPVADLGDDQTICSGATATLNVLNPSGYDVLWSTGETLDQITVDTAGTYSVTVSNGSCVVTDEIAVGFYENPSASIVAADACFGESILLSNADDTTGISYFWDFGDGTFSALSAPAKQYTSAGSFLVTLTVTDNTTGCQTTVQELVTTTALPSPNFVIRNGCEDQNRSFENITANQAQMSFVWDYGNGLSDTQPSGESFYADAGNYFISLTATDAAGCTNSITRELTVYAKPTVDIGDTISTCADEVELDAFNAGSSFRWSDNSTAQTYTVLRGRGGDYSVAVTNANGCTNSDTVTVVFNDKVFPDLGDDRAACAETTLDPGVSAAQFIWSTGEASETISVVESGTYWVQAVSSALCIASDTVAITINDLPVIDLENIVETCEGDSILLDATHPDAISYDWNTGESTASIYVKESGSYAVTLTNAEGCSYTETVLATIFSNPVIDLPQSIQACDSLVLNAGNRGADFLWSTGETTQFITVYSPDTYDLTVTNGDGCTTSASVQAVITTSPVIDLGADQEVCAGNTATLDPEVLFNATASLDYEWSTGQTDASITVSQAGTYFLTVYDENGCTTSDQVALAVNALPALNLGNDLTRCGIDGQQQDQVTLYTGLTGVSHLWGSETGLSGTADSLVATDDGRYWVTVTDAKGCSTSDTVRVSTTNNGIAASFLMPTEVVVGDEVHFVQLTEPTPVSFLWDFGNGVTSTRENPTRRFREAGEYEISLTVSNGACTNTLTKTLIVVEPGAESGNSIGDDPVFFLEIVRAQLYPNPSNGIFFFDFEFNKVVEARISIFDLAGNMLERHVIVTDKNKMPLDLSGLPAGMYLLDLEAPGRHRRYKFIIGTDQY